MAYKKSRSRNKSFGYDMYIGLGFVAAGVFAIGYGLGFFQ